VVAEFSFERGEKKELRHEPKWRKKKVAAVRFIAIKRLDLSRTEEKEGFHGSTPKLVRKYEGEEDVKGVLPRYRQSCFYI